MAQNFFQHVAENGIVAQPPHFGNHPPAAAAYQPFPGGPTPYSQQPTPVAPFGPLAQPPHFGNHPPAAGAYPPYQGGPTPYSQQPTVSSYQQTNPSQQQPVAPFGPLAQPPHFGNQPPAAGAYPPYQGGPTPYSQQPTTGAPYGPVAQTPYVRNHPPAAEAYPPCPGGSTPYSQQPAVSSYQQTNPSQQQPVVSNGPAPPQFSENLQLTGEEHRPNPVGQNPSIQQPPIRYNQQTIPGQQQSFPGVEYSPTSHEISDNSYEIQRLSIVRSIIIEPFNALMRNSGPADIFRYRIKIPNGIEMFYEQGQTNHYSEPYLGELETCSQAI